MPEIKDNVIAFAPYLAEKLREETEEWMKTNGIYPMNNVPNWITGLMDPDDTDDKPSS